MEVSKQETRARKEDPAAGVRIKNDAAGIGRDDITGIGQDNDGVDDLEQDDNTAGIERDDEAGTKQDDDKVGVPGRDNKRVVEPGTGARMEAWRLLRHAFLLVMRSNPFFTFSSSESVIG